jgi:hypothetical protein
MADNVNSETLKKIFENRRAINESKMKTAKRWSKFWFGFLIAIGVGEFLILIFYKKIFPSDEINNFAIIPIVFITFWVTIMFFMQRNNEGTYFTVMQNNDHKLAMIEIWISEEQKIEKMQKELDDMPYSYFLKDDSLETFYKNKDQNKTSKTELNKIFDDKLRNASRFINIICDEIRRTNPDYFTKTLHLYNSSYSIDIFSKFIIEANFIEQKSKYDKKQKIIDENIVNKNLLLNKIFNELTNNSNISISGNGKNKLDHEYFNVIKQLINK